MRMISAARRTRAPKPLPLITEGLPLLYEDDFEGDMGEATYHTDTDEILFNGLKTHLKSRHNLRVFSNLNMYYSPDDPRAYVSPDAMVVEPRRGLGRNVLSYWIGQDGPVPVLTAEVLSARTAQQRDLDEKLRVYGQLGVHEYVLVDVTGQFLKERLLLKRLKPDHTFRDEQDPDGGVTSQLGFRLMIDADDRLRVIDARTGRRYKRPDEAEEEALARELEAEARQKAEKKAAKASRDKREAERRIAQLEQELARLRTTSRPNGKKSTGRKTPKK